MLDSSLLLWISTSMQFARASPCLSAGASRLREARSGGLLIDAGGFQFGGAFASADYVRASTPMSHAIHRVRIRTVSSRV